MSGQEYYYYDGMRNDYAPSKPRSDNMQGDLQEQQTLRTVICIRPGAQGPWVSWLDVTRYSHQRIGYSDHQSVVALASQPCSSLPAAAIG